MTYLATAKKLADRTPHERNRVVDLMRVASILVVVFGHWLMAAVVFRDGELVAGHLMSLASWTHPLTWLLQVMPIFFFVGGYANALSLRSAQRRGEPYGSWLRTRLRRLTLPVVPLLVVWAIIGVGALAAGLDWQTLKLGSQVALVPTWFLAVYVVIVALAPVGLKIWERFGWKSIIAGLALAATADIVSIGLGVTLVGFLNYVFVWGTVHQLGYAWVDGSFKNVTRRVALMASGFAGVLALVWAGPYPVAMVGLVNAEITNSQPPRLTLAFLGLFQAGLVLVFEPLLARLANNRLVWIAVVAVSAQIMTIYLWHSTSLIVAIVASMGTGGLGMEIEPVTAEWWITRPVFFAILSAMTVGLALIFGRFERPQVDDRNAPPAWRPLLAVVGITGGLAVLAYTGIADADGLNGLAITLPMIGMAIGGVVGVTYTNRVGGH